jgi:hypothetical protein
MSSANLRSRHVTVALRLHCEKPLLIQPSGSAREAPEAAAVALEAHLKSAERKQLARLGDMRAHSPLVPPYLVETSSKDR